MREFQYLGFKTVEQVANATEDAKRKLGTLSKFVKLAKEWLAAANSDQNDVAKLRVQLEQYQTKYAKLEEKLELLMQRIEASEGTDLRDERTSDPLDDEPTATPRLRGRPRRV
jgi:outer membrane protein TolC